MASTTGELMPTLLTDVLPAREAGIAVAVGLGVIVAFQFALALGAPLGRAAWGGAQAELPARLRIASAVAVVIWLFAAVVVLGRVGIQVVPLPAVVLTWGTWILVVLLTVGAIMNFASSSRWERFLWAPLALLLALLTLVVALSA
jgi:hypothetical protein